MDEGGDGHNPGPITAELCAAYRSALKAQMKGLRDQIIGALTISTLVIGLWMYILRILPLT